VSHPEDIRSVHVEVRSPTAVERLQDAIRDTDCGDLLEQTETPEGRTVVVGPELALGHLYVTLDQHADEWADEREGRLAEVCDQLRDSLYDDLVNARAAVGLARIQRRCRRGGDRTAAEEAYGIIDEDYSLDGRADE